MKTDYKKLRDVHIANYCTMGEIDLLRQVVGFCNNRSEYDNEGKSVNKLINEFLKYNYVQEDDE